MKRVLLAITCLVFCSNAFAQLFYDHFDNDVVNFLNGASSYTFSESNSIWTIETNNKTGYEVFTYNINDHIVTKTIDVSDQNNSRYIVIRARAIDAPENIRIDFRSTNGASTTAPNGGPIQRTIQTGAFQEYTFDTYYSDWDPQSNKSVDWTQVSALDFYFSPNGTSNNTVEIDWIYIGNPTDPPVVNLGNDIDQCGLEYTIDAQNPGASYAWYKDNALITDETSRFLTVTDNATYKVEVTNLFNTSSDEINVNLRPTPIADFNMPTIGQVGNNISMTNTSTGATTYQWDIDNNGSIDYTTENINHTFSMAGEYEVRLLVGNGQCDNEIIKTIDVGVPPSVDLGSDIITCDGAVTLDAGNLGAKYSWSPIAWNLRTLSVSQSGNYAVTVTNKYGSDTDDINVTFKEQTVAGFVGPTLAEEGENVTFTDLSTGDIDTWTWDFGDGIGNSNSQNPTYAYPNAGTFTVSLTIDNGTCNDTYTFPILITEPCTPPSVDLGSDISQCGGTATLDAGVQPAGATYLWSTGAKTQSITVNESGYYSVQVNNACGQALDFVNVFINAIPVADAIIPSTGFVNESITFKDNSTSATSWEWDFGDVTAGSVKKNPTHTYTSTGTYTVSLIAKNGSCTDDVQGNITISTGGSTGTPPNVELGPTVKQCEGTVTLDAGTQPAGTTFNWSTGESTQTITVNASGVYSVTATNPAGVDNDFITVTIDQEPDATIIASDEATINQPVTFSNTSSVGSSWSWNFGDGSPVKTSQSPIHKFTALGDYTVTLTITNGQCSDTKTHDISVVETDNGGGGNNCTGSAPVVDLGNDITQCDGSVTLDAGTHSDNATYYWSPGGADTQTITVSTSNVYTVTVTNDCGFDSDNIVVIIPGTPDAAMLIPDSTEVNSITAFKDQTPQSVTKWDWDFGDESGTSSSKNPFYTYTETGTFTVSLTVENAYGCSNSTTEDIKVYQVLGIEEDLVNNSLNIYPNPASSTDITVEYDSEIPTVLSLYDLTGNMVFATAIDRGYSNYVLDKTLFTSGIYIVNITGEGININRKLIVY